MEPSAVSDLTSYQLYELSRNNTIPEVIQQAAKTEYESREIGYKQFAQILEKHYRNNILPDNEDLRPFYKLFPIIVPFFYMIGMIITANYIALGKIRKYRSFWRYTTIGHVVWALGFIGFFLFRRLILSF